MITLCDHVDHVLWWVDVVTGSRVVADRVAVVSGSHVVADRVAVVSGVWMW